MTHSEGTRVSSRRKLFGLGAAVVVVAAVVIAYASGAFGGGNATSGAGQADNAFPTSLATVTRRSLTSQTQVSATLGYAASDERGRAGGDDTSGARTGNSRRRARREAQLQTAQAALATDTAALGQADASLSADRGEADGRLRRRQRRRERRELLGRRRGRRGRRAVRDRLAGGLGRRAEPDAGSGQGREPTGKRSRPPRAGLRAARASSDAGAVVGDRLRPELDLHRAAGGRRRSSTGARRSTRSAISPVVLLYGPVAPWRAFMPGMSPGKDVAELNANLRALGYGARSRRRRVHRGDRVGDRRLPGRTRREPDRASCCSARSSSSRGRCG